MICVPDNLRSHASRLRKSTRYGLVSALFVLFCASGLSAQATSCRQALALGLDVSGSVDALEYRLQRDGLAFALGTRAVQTALLANPGSYVELLIYEWSGAQDQHVLVGWTPITSQDDIFEIQLTLSETDRLASSPATALGDAMMAGYRFLNMRKNCWVRTLDISGDGKSNSGPDPQDIQHLFSDAGIGVNGLVIGADAPGIGDLRQEEIGELVAYFQTRVIVGSDAFVQTAIGYEDYATSMQAKLEKELRGLVVSQILE